MAKLIMSVERGDLWQTLCRNNGQALLIAILMALLLVLSIPTIVFLNHVESRHQIASQKRVKAQGLAEEGLAYAINALSTAEPPTTTDGQTTWNNIFTIAQFPTVCSPTTGTTNIPSNTAPGAFFTVVCDRPVPPPEGFQNYQVRVVATAFLPYLGGAPKSIRTIEAYVSQRTLGARLASGETASAALVLGNIPDTSQNGALRVEWGPIVSFSQDWTAPPLVWQLWEPLNKVPGLDTTIGYPRKFAVGGITEATTFGKPFFRAPTPNPPASQSEGTTDRREYWAYSSIAFPPVIDDEVYYKPRAAAQGTHYGITPSPGQSFDSTYNPVGADTIYVDGDAVWDSLRLDLGTNGAFIVAGNLTLQNVSNALPSNTVVRVPNTAPAEYYYWNQAAAPSAAPWPCSTLVGNVCNPTSTTTPTNPINFKGFLWVKGNLIVNQPGWTIDGAVLVGDLQVGTGVTTPRLKITPGGSLTILYDDQINRAIHVYPKTTAGDIELQTDVLREI